MLKRREVSWRRKNKSIWDKGRGRSIGLFPWLEIDAKVKKKWVFNSSMPVACLIMHMRSPVRPVTHCPHVA
jgi:hypothetical protein